MLPRRSEIAAGRTAMALGGSHTVHTHCETHTLSDTTPANVQHQNTFLYIPSTHNPIFFPSLSLSLSLSLYHTSATVADVRAAQGKLSGHQPETYLTNANHSRPNYQAQGIRRLDFCLLWATNKSVCVGTYTVRILYILCVCSWVQPKCTDRVLR